MIFISKNFDELSTVELYEILKVRAEIFIVEQKMNCQDMDNIDFKSRHMFLKDNNRIVAYLRAFETGDSNTVKIGRVLTLNHGVGLGKKLMLESIKEIKDYYKCKKISLNSQKTAIGFYKKLGFKVTSNEFFEEGIAHIKMELDIN